MSEDKKYTVELTMDEMALVRAGVRNHEKKNKADILDYIKHPHRAEDKDLKRWHKDDVETAVALMVLSDKLWNM